MHVATLQALLKPTVEVPVEIDISVAPGASLKPQHVCHPFSPNIWGVSGLPFQGQALWLRYAYLGWTTLPETTVLVLKSSTVE